MKLRIETEDADELLKPIADMTFVKMQTLQTYYLHKHRNVIVIVIQYSTMLRCL